jgi:hypothetical protein
MSRLPLAVRREVQITRVERVRMKLAREDLVELLAAGGVHVPPDAKIQFTVPGGGDWSNAAIDISKTDPIEVTWTTESTGEEPVAPLGTIPANRPKPPPAPGNPVDRLRGLGERIAKFTLDSCLIGGVDDARPCLVGADLLDAMAQTLRILTNATASEDTLYEARMRGRDLISIAEGLLPTNRIPKE